MFLPPVRLQWRHVWLATALSAAAWLLGAEILTLYAVFFSNSFSAYGVVGALLVLMLWMHATSKVLFFGAELCKVASGGSDKPARTRAAISAESVR
jgi:membrane protein